MPTGLPSWRTTVPHPAPLLLPGLLLLAGCVWLAWRYPLRAGLQDPRGSWATLAGGSWGNLTSHALVYALMSLAVWLAVRRSHAHPVHRISVWIIGVWCAASLILLAVYPGGESHDVFDYLFRGRMIDVRGISPLLITPNAYPRDPFYAYIAWYAYVDTYGPLWEYASAGVARITRAAYSLAGISFTPRASCPRVEAACGALIWQLSGYRVLAIVATGLSAALIARLVRRTHPQLVATALVFWLWNPLMLISMAVGAHNDALILPLQLGILLAFGRDRRVAGWLLLAAAAHIKLTALLLLPVLAIWALRRVGWRAFAEGLLALAIAAPVSWLLYAPLGGWLTLERMLAERLLFSANSLAWVVYQALRTLDGWEIEPARELVHRGATALFALLALVLLWRLWHRARGAAPAVLVASARDLTLLYLLVGSFWFQPWYLTGALVLTAAVPDARQHGPLLIVGCAGALLSNIVGDYLFQLPGKPFDLITIRTLAIFGMVMPLLLLLTARVLAHHKTTTARAPWRRVRM